MDDPTLSLPPVSATAVGVAAIRAAEAARPDALFRDPLADVFVRAAGGPRRPSVEDGRPEAYLAALILWVRVRTRFLDDLVLDACAHGCRQLVTLGAGLDARAFRLALPGDARLFELDLADILAFKQRVLAGEPRRPACERIVVPTDLTGDWTRDLGDAGFDATQPTAWLAEGLLVYLPEAAREALIDQVTGLSQPGSGFGITLASVRRRPDRGAGPASVSSRPGDFVALWQSDAPPDVAVWLEPRGWAVREFDAFERAGRYGLTASRPAGGGRARLVDATRR
ncbi:MAG TPA: SAM-dependent methyltransferase [Acidimicrobiia bacterium]|nr:SAM-dependent methyltransferase [Acidimicrobiia bacterium]